MPESNETLSDQVENDQIRPDIEQDQSVEDQVRSTSEEVQAGDEELQPQPAGLSSDSDTKRKKAARKKAKAALKAVFPPAGRRKRQYYTEQDIHLSFTSCGRCSLFLVKYRLSHQEEMLEAIEEIDTDWLVLPWHPDMREIVNASYGARIDIESYYLEGTCPECLRPFCFAKPEPDQPAWFLVKI
jgi:hypothetical protein